MGCSLYQDFGENNPHSHFFAFRLADQPLPGQEILSPRPCISSLICYLPSWVDPQQGSFFPLSFVPIEQDKVCSEAKESFILSSKGRGATSEGNLSLTGCGQDWFNGFSSAWLPWWLREESICLQCGRSGFEPQVGKIPWRRKWQATPVLLPGKFHGRRSLVN